MARWIVPAGTQDELDQIETNDNVINGEIVYNTTNSSIMVGVVDSSGPNITHEYQTVVGANQITDSLIANSTITLAKFASRGASEIITGSGTGVEGTQLMLNEVLTYNGTDLVSSAVTDAMVQADGGTLSFESIEEVPANTIIANTSTTANAHLTEVAVADNRLLGRHNSGSIGGTQVQTEHIADAAVTLAKMANLTGPVVLGRDSGSGAPLAMSPSTTRGILVSGGNAIDFANSDGVINHSDTSSVLDVTETNRTYLSGITFDTYGHVLTTDTQGISAGEGIDISTAGAISGEDATTANKGIASFNSSDFSVASGAVSLNTAAGNGVRGLVSATDPISYNSMSGVISHDNSSGSSLTAPTFTTNGDITLMAGLTIDSQGHVDAAPVTRSLTDGDNIVFTAGGGGTSMEISVPRATTSVRGVAAFNDSHFDVTSAAAVSLDTSEVGGALDDHSVPLSKLPNITGDGFLGSNDAGATDVEVLGPSAVREVLNLQPGNGLELNTTDNTINVSNISFSNNYVFTTVAQRNTGIIGSTTITWQAGDVAVTTATPTEVWIYVNPTAKTGAVVDSDFAEATLDPTNLTVTGRSATGLTIASSTGTDTAVPVATTTLAGLQSATDKAKLDSVEANANNYSFNISATGTTGTGTIADNETLGFTHSGAATVTRSGDNINVHSINTLYSAGNGLNLNGTVFSADAHTGITVDGNGISVNAGAVNHDALQNFVANEHIDHSNVSISAGTGLTGGGNLTASRTLAVNPAAVNHDALQNFVANEHINHANVSITAGTGLTGGGTIAANRTLAVNPAAVNHDALQNFVANEHINHANVTLTAGTGLTGGGTIAASRTFNIDIASEAEAIAGTDNAHVMTPLRVQNVKNNIVVIEPESNGDPVVGDFTNGALFVAQY